jgi:hypothetical protein
VRSGPLKEYEEAFKHIKELVIDPILKKGGMPPTQWTMYYDFTKELCKVHELDELMDKYVRRYNLDPSVLREIAKRRSGIRRALYEPRWKRGMRSAVGL